MKNISSLPAFPEDQIRERIRPRMNAYAVFQCDCERQAIDAIEASADGLAYLFSHSGEKVDPRLAPLVAAHHAFVIPTLSDYALPSAARGNRLGLSIVDSTHGHVGSVTLMAGGCYGS